MPDDDKTFDAVIRPTREGPGGHEATADIEQPTATTREPAEAREQSPAGDAAAPMAERIAVANQQLASSLDQLRQPEGHRSADDAVSRLLAIVEELHRTTSSAAGGGGIAADIIARIERLESWVATNRLP
jgi:hypothetical protein